MIFRLVRMWLHDFLMQVPTGHNDLWPPVQVRNSEFLYETCFDHAKWRILTVANTRQMVPGKKVKIKFQNLSKKRQKLYTLCFIARVQDLGSAARDGRCCHLVVIKFEVANSGGRLWFESWKRSLPFDLLSFLVCHNIYLGLHLTYKWIQMVFRARTVGGGVHVCLECWRSRSTSRGPLWCWHASTPNWGCLAGRKDKGPQKDLFQCVFPPGLASLTIRQLQLFVFLFLFVFFLRYRVKLFWSCNSRVCFFSFVVFSLHPKRSEECKCAI